jgi:hypothetical protein
LKSFDATNLKPFLPLIDGAAVPISNHVQAAPKKNSTSKQKEELLEIMEEMKQDN